MIYAINTLVACCFINLVEFILTLISEIYKKQQVLRRQQHRKFIIPTETHSQTGQNWLC